MELNGCSAMRNNYRIFSSNSRGWLLLLIFFFYRFKMEWLFEVIRRVVLLTFFNFFFLAFKVYCVGYSLTNESTKVNYSSFSESASSIKVLNFIFVYFSEGDNAFSNLSISFFNPTKGKRSLSLSIFWNFRNMLI